MARDDERRGRGWDSALAAVAKIGLVSAGAYAGLRYFPSISTRRAISAFERTLGHQVGRLGRAIDKELPAGAASPLWRYTRPDDLTLLPEVKAAIRVFRSQSRISGGAVDDVTRALFTRTSADIPQAVGSLTPLTVGEFFSGFGVKRLIEAVGAEPVSELRGQLGYLARLPGLRQSMARIGRTPADLMNIPVGAFMLRSDAGALSARAGLRAMFEDVSQLRIPFTQFRPFSLLIPDLKPKPALAFLGKKASQAMFGASNALFIGGIVHPVEKGSSGRTFGDPRGGYKLASSYRTGVAAAAAARMGLLEPRPGPQATGPRGWLQRQGVGPEWSSKEARVQTIWQGLWRSASNRAQQFPTPGGTPAGGVTPEGAFLHRLLRRPAGMAQSTKDLTLVERAKLFLGGTVRRPFVSKGKFELLPVAELAGSVQRDPLPSAFGKSPFYATKGRESITDWLNYQVTRPLWLMSEMTGMSIKPGKTPLGSLGQIGLKLALPAYLGYQGLDYLEYKSKRLLGVGPITGAAWMYTRARIGAQAVLDATGITETLQNIEEKYPGLIESPASKGIRAGASVLGGLLGARRVGSKYAKLLSLGAGMATGYLQMAGVSQTAADLSGIYAGEKDVPVKSGRWWFLGRDSFSGSKIKYFAKSWYHELWNRPKEVGLYGGRQQAWQGSWLPTPENWMLLKNVVDPYYLERRHFFDRPYPETSGLGGDIPIVGPLVERTAGRLIKPVQRREIPVGAGAPAPGGKLGPALQTSGRPSQTPVSTRDRLDLMTGETIYRTFEWTGLPGFMLGAISENLLGDGLLDRRALAASGAMTSASKDFRERNLGGLAGLTELYRRFVPTGPSYRTINPLENRMPAWLPGSKSVFSEDRANYSIDFHRGDAFRSVEKGESRLPGAGWEAAHQGVAGVTPGMYSSLDRFEMLGDVALGSAAFKHYRRAVQGQIEAGVLSDAEIKRFTNIENQIAEKAKSRVGGTGYRYASDAFKTTEATIASTDMAGFTTYEHPGMKFHLAGVETRPYALEGASDGAGKLRRRLAELRGQTVSMTYGGFGPTTPAILGDVNEWAIEAGMGKYKPVDDLDYRAKHGTSLLQRSYESVVHTSLPGPLGYPRTKFLGQMAPVEEYEQFLRFGTHNNAWEHPVENYLIPGFNQMLRTTSTAQLQARRVNQAMDRFKYVKYSALSDNADAMGDAQAANAFDRRAAQTLVAANPYAPSFYKNIFGALPPTERPFFAAFAGVTSESQQERILNSVPENMKPVYMGVWDRQAGTSGFDSPVLQRYAEEARELYTQPPDARIAERLAHQPLPAGDYAGWDPGVDDDTMRIKLAQQEGLDAHQVGLWPEQEREAEAFDFGSPGRMSGAEIEALLKRLQYRNYMISSGLNENSTLHIGKPRSERWKKVRRNAQLQGAL